MKKRISVILPALIALLLSMAMLAGCAAQQAPKKETMELADARGEIVTLTKNPEKVIVIDPAMCDIFYAIGAQDSLVAVGSYCEYPDGVEEKTKVGAYDDLNVEELVALKPELILFGSMSTDDAKLGALKSAGIEVIGLSSDTIQDAYNNIKNMGLLMNKASEADQVVADMKAKLDAVAAMGAAQGEKKTVFIEVSPVMFGLFTCGGGTFQDELIKIAGAENIFGNEDRWPSISEEQVIQLSPDVIISMTQFEGYDPVEDISSRAGWENITAVKNGEIYYLDPSFIAVACPRLTLGAERIYEVVYGG